MAYLYRDGKCEFSGTRKQIISYILTSYADDYWVMEYNKQLTFDTGKFLFVLDCLGLEYYENKRRGKY